MAANRVISPELQGMLRAVQRKYQTDFVGFYKSLAGHFVGQRQATKDATLSRQNVEKVIRNIDEVLTPSGEVTNDTINKLNSSFDVVKKDIDFWLKEAETDTELSSNFEKIFEKRQLSPKVLRSDQAIITSRISKLLAKKPSFTEKWKAASPTSYGLVADLGKSVLGSVLGPFGTIAETAFGVGKELLAAGRARKNALERARLTESLLSGGERTPEGMAKMQSFLSGFGRAEVKRDIRGESLNRATLGEKVNQLNPFAQPSAGTGIPGGGVVPGGSNIDAVSALTTFFNGPMIRTKWSKALFELLEGKFKPTKIEEKAGTSIIPLGGIPAAIVSAVQAALATLVTGAVAWFAGKTEQRDAKRLFGEEAFKNAIDPSKSFGKLAEPVHALGTGLTEIATSPIDLAGSYGKLGMDLGLKASGSKIERASMPSASSLLMMGGMNLVSRAGGFIEKKFPGVFKKEEISETPSTSTSKKPENVPLVPGSLEQTSSEGFNKLAGAFQELSDKISKQTNPLPIRTQSGKNAYNTGDPLTEFLNLGMFDVASS